MSQPNQHKNTALTAAKAQTNQKLAEAVQSPIRASDRVRAELNQELQQRMDRRAQVLGILDAFTQELNDEDRTIEALHRALDSLAEEGTKTPTLNLVINEAGNE